MEREREEGRGRWREARREMIDLSANSIVSLMRGEGESEQVSIEQKEREEEARGGRGGRERRSLLIDSNTTSKTRESIRWREREGRRPTNRHHNIKVGSEQESNGERENSRRLSTHQSKRKEGFYSLK